VILTADNILSFKVGSLISTCASLTPAIPF